MSGSEILGIGSDIVEIARIRHAIEAHGSHLLNRLFTQKEQDYCLKHKDAVPHFAGRFCAKEAISKALGVGIGEYSAWKDIEILNNAQGKPEVFFSKAVKDRLGDPQVLVTISHCEHYATAFAIRIR